MDRVQSPGRSSPFSPSSLGFQLSSTPTDDHLYLHVTLMTIDAHGRLYDCSCYLSSSPLRIDDFKTSRPHWSLTDRCRSRDLLFLNVCPSPTLRHVYVYASPPWLFRLCYASDRMDG
jgi:hypothetical protein